VPEDCPAKQADESDEWLCRGARKKHLPYLRIQSTQSHQPTRLWDQSRTYIINTRCPCTFRMRRTCYLRLKGRQVGEASFFSSGARNRCLLIHVSPSNLCTVTPPQFKVVMWIDLVRAIKSKIASSFHQAPSHLYNSGANTVINNHSLPPLRQSF
jgi:hypothetical protein